MALSNSMTQLGDHLVAAGLITREQLDIALLEQAVTGERLTQVLLRFAFASREQVFSALASIDPQALMEEKIVDTTIPAKLLLETSTAVIAGDGTHLYVATLDNNPRAVCERLQQYAGDQKLRLIEVATSAIHAELDRMRREERAAASIAEDADVNEVISALLKEAMRRGASDIHIEPSDKTVHVRVRVDGILRTVRTLPQALEPRLISRLKDKAGMDVSCRHMPQDGSFSEAFRGRPIDYRVATLPQGGSREKVTMRILDKEKVLVDIARLGISRESDWVALSELANGLVLVCGATGSGKTTTLYSTVNRINKFQKSVYTIEDPIEYHLPFITQTQVNKHTGLTFSAFLRTLLRHDPDVVVVGEIRDTESAENALHLADTGHLVYATLHTNDVPSTLMRLQGLGVGETKLAYVLRGILVQHLVRCLCGGCVGKGCSECGGEGYRGRTLLTEFVRFDHPDQVREAYARKLAYYTFRQDAERLLASGATNGAEIYRVMGECVCGPWCEGCALTDSCRWKSGAAPEERHDG